MINAMRILTAAVLVLAASSAPRTAQAHPLVLGDLDGGEQPQTVAESLDRMDRITGT